MESSFGWRIGYGFALAHYVSKRMEGVQWHAKICTMDRDTNLLTCQLVNWSTKIKDDYATPYYIYGA